MIFYGKKVEKLYQEGYLTGCDIAGNDLNAGYLGVVTGRIDLSQLRNKTGLGLAKYSFNNKDVELSQVKLTIKADLSALTNDDIDADIWLPTHTLSNSNCQDIDSSFRTKVDIKILVTFDTATYSKKYIERIMGHTRSSGNSLPKDISFTDFIVVGCSFKEEEKPFYLSDIGESLLNGVGNTALSPVLRSQKPTPYKSEQQELFNFFSAKSQKHKDCDCGAAFSSFPDYHSEYCKLGILTSSPP